MAQDATYPWFLIAAAIFVVIDEVVRLARGERDDEFGATAAIVAISALRLTDIPFPA